MHVARKIHIHIQTQPRIEKRVKGIEMALQHAIARFSRGILFNPSPSHPTNRSANIASAQATANPKTPFRPPIHYATGTHSRANMKLKLPLLISCPAPNRIACWWWIECGGMGEMGVVREFSWVQKLSRPTVSPVFSCVLNSYIHYHRKTTHMPHKYPTLPSSFPMKLNTIVGPCPRGGGRGLLAGDRVCSGRWASSSLLIK